MTDTLTPIADPEVRVRLANDEYMNEYGGRLRAGTAVEVDQKTASRWLRKGIAEPAERGDLTLREQKLAQIAMLQAEADELGRFSSGSGGEDGDEYVPVLERVVRRGPGRPPKIRPDGD